MAQKQKQDFNLNNADMFVLPHSEETENSVLATILDMPYEYYPTALKYLKAKGMFYNPLNSELWNIIQAISKDGEVSPSKVRAVVDGMGDSEKLNNFLAICRMVTMPSEFQSQCLMLNEFWIKRSLHRFGYYLNQKALTIDALELLGACSDTTDIIYRHIHQMTEITLKDGVQELAKELHDISLSENGMLGLQSSISGINEVIKGYRRGNLIVLAGSTGEGKTTLECQEIRHLIEKGIPVGCFTLEMKTSEIILMMACDALGLNSEAVISGKLSAAELSHLATYMERVKKMPLKISDKPAIKIGELKSVARMWKKNNNIKVLFIDLIHLMEGDVHYSSPEQKYTDIANQIKALAKELDIPIVALAHLHRKEKGDKTAHVIANLKYASGIEQAADVVMLIYRPELYDIETHPDGTSTKGFAKIIIGKLRLLPKRDVKCHFSGTRFTDLEEHQYRKLDEAPLRANAGFQNYNPNKTIESNKSFIESDQPF